jgi:putative peptide zinc metalloprotease protein
MSSADHRRSATDRTLGLRARGDLQSVEASYGAQSTFVVKDPIANQSFHLTAEEHCLLTALKKPMSFRGLQRLLESRFAPRRVSITELQVFVTRLYDQGLLVGQTPGQGVELLARGERRRRQSRWSSLLQVLAIRVGGFHAAPLIERLYGAIGWLCSRWSVFAVLLLATYAAIVVIGNSGTIAARLPAIHELVELRRLPLWLAAIAGVKVLHELGHALACRHFGARPQELGLLLLAGAPALYCDVSDAWRLPNKWHRMAVSAAGMFVELAIASIAVLVWYYAAPGMLSAICLSLIVVCSVGTLAVNANPLLRYDGYYILADWLETPNLGDRARGLIAATWRRWLLGEPTPADALITPGKRRALWIYAILSKVYMALVLVGLLMLGLKLAKPQGLENAVYTFAVIVLTGLLVRPVIATTKLLLNPSVRGRLRTVRLAGTFAVLAGLGVAAWFIPMTRHVSAPLAAMPAESHPLFAVAAGELQQTAGEGSWVEAGDVVARLTNPEIELAVVRAEGAVREHRTRLAQLRTLQATMPAAARLIPTAAAELADAEAQLAEQRTVAESLVIRAPVAGRVLAPPSRAIERHADDALAPWSGSPLEARNRGAWIEPGTPLAVIASPGGWTAWAGVDQADAPAVEVGQTARLIVDERPTEILTARVTQVSRRARENNAGADAQTRQQRETLGDDRYHVVELALDGLDGATQSALFAGARGTVKITAERTTLGELAWLHLCRTFTSVF